MFNYKIENNICYYSGTEFDGSTQLESLLDAFRNNTTLLKVMPLEGASLVTGITNARDTFNGCTALIYADLSGFSPDVTVTNTNYLFHNCSNLNEVKLFPSYSANSSYCLMDGAGSAGNTLTIYVGKTANHAGSYSNATKLVFKPINDTYTLTDLTDAASNGTNLTEVDMSALTCNGTKFEYVYSGNTKLEKVTLPKMGSLSSIKNPFQDSCGGDTTLKVSGNLYNLNSVENLFNSCKAGLIDLDGLLFPEKSNIESLFANCSNLTKIDFTGHSFAGTNFASFALNCSNIEYLDCSNITVLEGSSMVRAFEGMTKLQIIKYPKIVGSLSYNLVELWPVLRNSGSADLSLTVYGDFSESTYLPFIFAGSKYSNIDISNITTPSENCSIEGWFYNSSNLTKIDLSNITINATDFSNFARNCSNVVSADFSGVTLVTRSSMVRAFESMTKLENIKYPKIVGGLATYLVSSWPVMKNAGASDLTLTVNGDFSEATYLPYIFANSNYKVINLDKVVWPSEKLDLEGMFYNSSNLTTISSENIFNGNDSANVFEGCSTKLVGGNGTVWNSSNITGQYAVIDTDSSTGYLTAPIPTYSLTITVDNPEAGKYTKVDNKDGSFTVTFTPNEGYNFVSLHLEGREDEYYRNNPCVVKLPNLGDYTATINTTNQTQSENEYNKGTELEDLVITSDTIGLDRATGWLSHPNLKLYTIYTPTEEQLLNFGGYLYTTDLLNAFYKAIEGVMVDVSFMDMFINFMSVPCNVANQNTGTVKLGWVTPVYNGSNISMNYTNDNVVEVDCGLLYFEPVYNNHLDYECDAKIFLPYIGYETLSPLDVIGKTLNVIYTIDLLTGSCVAAIKVDNSVRYQYVGNCGYTMSLSDTGTGASPLKAISSAINAVISAGSAVGGEKGSKVLSIAKNTLDTMGVDVSNKSSNIQRGGGLGGNSGCLGAQSPYIIVEYPNLSLPNNFGHLNGYPCNKYLNLSSLSGYTEVGEIHLEGFNCTVDELSEIESLLKSGVYL